MLKGLMSRLKKHRRMVLGLVVLVVVAFMWLWPSTPEPEDRTMSEIQTMIANREVREATLFEKEHSIKVSTNHGAYQAVFLEASGEQLVEQLRSTNTNFKVESDDTFWLISFISVAWFPLMLVLLLLSPQFMGGSLGSIIGRSTDYRASQPTERFADVKGADEAVGNVQIVVRFLRDPAPFKGIKLERGILFEGPTGTGKTLLAKAVAGEAGVPYYELSGSGLTSMWRGGTTQRIEQFFTKIKKSIQPDQAVVIFFDELDGLATKRGEILQASDQDAASSITQFLHQVTSLLASHPYAILIGATNHIKSLDPAVIRPGRFGLHISMPNPDRRARLEILQLNSHELNLGSSELVRVADLTAGMSGAAVASIPNRAAVLAKELSKAEIITQRYLEQASMEMAMGILRHSAVVPPEDLRISAIHESGHSVLAHCSPYHRLLVVTTIPISESGGSTWCPPVDRMVIDEDSLLWRMAVMMGGREAELIGNNSRSSSGASHDISQATSLALSAVCEWGLFDTFLTGVDLRRWEEHPRADKIDNRVQQLVRQATEKAREVLARQESLCEAIQAQLAEKRILHSDELQVLTAEYATA